MLESVDIIIEKLKGQYRVKSDQELARALKLGRSTIATWKSRQSVPDKYVKIAQGPYGHQFYGETPWELWTPLERAGMELALMRLMRDFKGMISDYAVYLREGPLVSSAVAEYHGDATDDIACKMADTGLQNERQALHIMVFEEFFKTT